MVNSMVRELNLNHFVERLYEIVSAHQGFAFLPSDHQGRQSQKAMSSHNLLLRRGPEARGGSCAKEDGVISTELRLGNVAGWM